jgi:hypothetical protein
MLRLLAASGRVTAKLKRLENSENALFWPASLEKGGRRMLQMMKRISQLPAFCEEFVQ